MYVEFKDGKKIVTVDNGDWLDANTQYKGPSFTKEFPMTDKEQQFLKDLEKHDNITVSVSESHRPRLVISRPKANTR